jgi:hypothetical protein
LVEGIDLHKSLTTTRLNLYFSEEAIRTAVPCFNQLYQAAVFFLVQVNTFETRMAFGQKWVT